MTLAIRLDPKLEARLTQLALATHRTKTYYVTKALESYIEDLEDIHIALERLENPGGPYITMEEIKRELELEDSIRSKSRKKPEKARPKRKK